MDSENIEMQAADWLARRDGGAWRDADESEFREWQAKSTANRVAVIRLKTVWQQADRLQALGAGVRAGDIPSPGQWLISPSGKSTPVALLIPSPAKRGRIRVGAFFLNIRPAIAASVLIVAVLISGGFFLFRTPNTYHTPIGATQSVHLPDGSRVTLNTDSKIHVVLNDSERRIELDRGEAFFDVAKDTARPFIVWAAHKRVVAVGTKFSVLREGDDVRVVVTEGRVRVEKVQLDAGGVAQADAVGVRVKAASVADAEKYVSWREGYLSFHDTPLAQAVAEFNRYHRVKLVVADPALADLRIGGNLRTTNLEAFVRVLEQGFPVRAQEEGDRIVLTAR